MTKMFCKGWIILWHCVSSINNTPEGIWTNLKKVEPIYQLMMIIRVSVTSIWKVLSPAGPWLTIAIELLLQIRVFKLMVKRLIIYLLFHNWFQQVNYGNFLLRHFESLISKQNVISWPEGWSLILIIFYQVGSSRQRLSSWTIFQIEIELFIPIDVCSRHARTDKTMAWSFQQVSL